MASWRMAFRTGNKGLSLWPECLRLNVAVITYLPLADIDLRLYPEFEPKDKWRELSPSQRSSLGKVAYAMQGGDVIYVKEGPNIVGKGVVSGPPGQPAYEFDPSDRIVTELEIWRHQVPVKWEHGFAPVRLLIGTSQQFVVQAIGPADVTRLEALCNQNGAIGPATGNV
jgi:hypothetical protein